MPLGLTPLVLGLTRRRPTSASSSSASSLLLLLLLLALEPTSSIAMRRMPAGADSPLLAAAAAAVAAAAAAAESVASRVLLSAAAACSGLNVRRSSASFASASWCSDKQLLENDNPSADTHLLQLGDGQLRLGIDRLERKNLLVV